MLGEAKRYVFFCLASVFLVPRVGRAADITLSERSPLAFLLNMPTGGVAKTNQSDVIRKVSKRLRDHTDLFIQQIDQFVVADCEGRLACIVLKVRRDYNRQALQDAYGKLEPFSKHLALLKEEERAYPRYLLMLSMVPTGESDRVSGLLIDTDLALSLHHSTERKPGWKDAVEVEIAERATIARLDRAQIEDGPAMDRYLDRAFARPLRRGFEAHWAPYGVIQLDAKVAGAEVTVDGRSVGVLDAGQNRLLGVRSGERTIGVSKPGFAPFETKVQAVPGETVSVQLALEATAGDTVSLIRTGIMWGGVAVAVAGIATTAVALARASDVQVSCFSSDERCTGGNVFLTTGYAPENVGTLAQVNPSGVLLGPLGYSLFAVGAGWAITALILKDSEQFPWIELLVGVVAGSVAYGVSALADPPRSRVGVQ